MILLDTDVIIDHLRGREVIPLTTIVDLGTAISVITHIELTQGVIDDLQSPQARILKKMLEDYRIDIIDLSVDIGQTYCTLKHRLRSRTITDFDLLIAATAMTHDASLYTRNTKHFDRIPGIRLYTP